MPYLDPGELIFLLSEPKINYDVKLGVLSSSPPISMLKRLVTRVIVSLHLREGTSYPRLIPGNVSMVPGELIN